MGKSTISMVIFNSSPLIAPSFGSISRRWSSSLTLWRLCVSWPRQNGGVTWELHSRHEGIYYITILHICYIYYTIWIYMIMIYCDNLCVVYHGINNYGISVYITSPKRKPLVSHIQKQTFSLLCLGGWQTHELPIWNWQFHELWSPAPNQVKAGRTLRNLGICAKTIHPSQSLQLHSVNYQCQIFLGPSSTTIIPKSAAFCLQTERCLSDPQRSAECVCVLLNHCLRIVRCMFQNTFQFYPY